MTHEPLSTRCDFCGDHFTAEHPMSRTCYGCRAKGAPDQSQPGYEAGLSAWKKRKAR